MYDGEEQLGNYAYDTHSLPPNADGMKSFQGGHHEPAQYYSDAMTEAAYMDNDLHDPAGVTRPSHQRRASFTETVSRVLQENHIVKLRRQSREEGARCWVVLSGCITLVVGILFVVYTSRLGHRAEPVDSAGDNSPSSVGVLDLDFLCSDEKMAAGGVGLEPCWKACQAASCCYSSETTESCSQESHDFCEKYHLCSPFFLPQEIVSNAPSNIASICALNGVSTENGLAECEMNCLEAACCWPSAGSANCFEGNNVACEGFNACETVTGEVAGPAVVEVSLDYVKDVCSEGSVKHPKGLALCLTACTDGMCCFEGEGKSCEGENDDNYCATYGPCAAIFVEDEVPAVDLESTCDSTSPIYDLDQCRELCEPGRCCFSESDECEAVCTDYASCVVAFSNASGDLPTTTSDSTATSPSAWTPLTKACSDDGLKDEQEKKVCENLCSTYRCCFIEGEGSCKAQDYCNEWSAPCTKLFNDDNSEGSDLKNEGYQESSHDSPITLACASDTSPSSSCQQMCKPFKCCFVSEENSECADFVDPLNSCEESGSPCASLFATDISESDSEEQENFTAFVPPANFSVSELEDSLVKQSCGTDKVKNQDVWHNCQALCESFRCCSAETAGSCQDVSDYEDACEAWGAICKTIIEKDMEIISDELEQPSTNSVASSNLDSSASVNDSIGAPSMQDACSPENIETQEGMSACKDLCSGWECCFMVGKETCMDDEDCEHVRAPCSILYDFQLEGGDGIDTTSTPVPGEISAIHDGGRRLRS